MINSFFQSWRSMFCGNFWCVVAAQNIQSQYLSRHHGHGSSSCTAQTNFFVSPCCRFTFLWGCLFPLLLTFGDRSIRSQGPVSAFGCDSATLHKADLVCIGQLYRNLILVQETYQPLGYLVFISKLAPYRLLFLVFIQSWTDSSQLNSWVCPWLPHIHLCHVLLKLFSVLCLRSPSWCPRWLFVSLLGFAVDLAVQRTAQLLCIPCVLLGSVQDVLSYICHRS